VKKLTNSFQRTIPIALLLVVVVAGFQAKAFGITAYVYSGMGLLTTVNGMVAFASRNVWFALTYWLLLGIWVAFHTAVAIYVFVVFGFGANIFAAPAAVFLVLNLVALSCGIQYFRGLKAESGTTALPTYVMIQDAPNSTGDAIGL